MTRLRDELVVINILCIFFIIIAALLPLKVLTIIFGLPFILFFLGYALSAAFFPKRTDLQLVERIALSFGLSIAIVPIVALILNYTTWGITLYPLLVSVTLLIFAASTVALYRRYRMSEKERHLISFTIDLSRWAKTSTWDKILSIIVVASILGAMGSIIYVIVTPQMNEKFTEFYVLGSDGKLTNYPYELTIGEEGKVTLGIVNHEHEDALTYWVEILTDGEGDNIIGPVVLNHGSKWESEAYFTPQKAGGNQTVEFLLFKNSGEELYKSLYLRIDVKDAN